MKHVQKGFTLIELMIVVAIIGILAAIAIPQYQNYITRSKWQDNFIRAESLKLAIAECSQNNAGVMSNCDTFGVAGSATAELSDYGPPNLPAMNYGTVISIPAAATATAIIVRFVGAAALGGCTVELTGDNSSIQNITWTFANTAGTNCNKSKTGVGT